MKDEELQLLIKERNEWIWHGVYGQHRTANSVAYILRQKGWLTKIEHDNHDNATIYKRRPTT